MSRHYALFLALALAACPRGHTREKTQNPDHANPFFTKSELPLEAPPFDKIKDTDYQPALEEGMKQHLVEVEAIANQKDEPTFDNTIVALEKSGILLTRVERVFFSITQSNTNDTLQKVEEEISPKLTAHEDEIYLNAKLFTRVKAIYEKRDSISLNAEQKYLVERYYREFVRSGANLSEDEKTKLRTLNQEESKLSTDFENKLLAGTKDGGVVIDDKAQLEGVDESEISAAAEAAKERGLTGKWVISLQNTTQQPLQSSLKNRAVREKLYRASTERTSHGDANDTRALISRLAQLRAEKAKILGYPTYADYVLDDQMAKTPTAATKLLSGLVPAATKKARGEISKMQALIDKQNGGFTLAPWDWQYYAEQVRKAEYDLDESQLKPYFELDKVLQDGVFFAANKLYGLTFKERKDIPVYHPDVRVFEVYDADGSLMALFYCDYFARDSKGGGAWEDAFVSQAGLLDQKPVIYNVTNFTKPAPGEPALISFDDASTMFHEFGHALHAMFSNVEYPTIGGTNTPNDFVEFPSQFNEHWALEPTVFANYAKHYKTGEPMPQALVDKIKKASTFNQGFATTEYLEASLLDLAWHALPPTAPKQDVETFEAATLKQFSIPEVPPRYRTSYFAHIWGGGYAAGYYAYLWSEVIDDDAFAWFKEHGGMTRENGQIFREKILSRGGSQDVGDMYRAFRGKDPSIEPLLEDRGLKEN
jgi:peptidyl-dipeptidase Dcp